MIESISDMVFRLARERAEMEEVMAETMLTDPRGYGILLIEETPIVNLEDVMKNDYTISFSLQWRLDEDVPFGHLYSFSSEAAVDRWRERGAPRL